MTFPAAMVTNSVTILERVEEFDSRGAKTGDVFVEGDSVDVNMQPRSAQRTFEEFQLEVERPVVLYCDVLDGEKIKTGYRLQWGADLYEVLAGPVRVGPWKNIGYAKFLLRTI